MDDEDVNLSSEKTKQKEEREQPIWPASPQSDD